MLCWAALDFWLRSCWDPWRCESGKKRVVKRVDVFEGTERGHRKKSSQSAFSAANQGVSPVIALSFVTEGLKIRAVSPVLVGEHIKNSSCVFLKVRPSAQSLSLSFRLYMNPTYLFGNEAPMTLAAIYG